MEYQIRKACPDDLPRIEEIYAYARVAVIKASTTTEIYVS